MLWNIVMAEGIESRYQYEELLIWFIVWSRRLKQLAACQIVWDAGLCFSC